MLNNRNIFNQLVPSILNQVFPKNLDRLSPAIGSPCEKCSKLGMFCRDGWSPSFQTTFNCKCCDHLWSDHL